MAKRTLALLLACLLVMAAAGCGKTQSDPETAETVTPAETPVTDEQTVTQEVEDTAAEAEQSGVTGQADLYPQQELMLTTNGVETHWKELNYFINYHASNVEKYMTQNGLETDWSAEFSEGRTFGDFVLEGAVDSCISFGAIDKGAKELGVSLTDEETAAFDEQWQQILDTYDSEEAAMEALTAVGVDEELYKELLYYATLSEKCFDSLYGKDASKLTDEECAAYTENDGYLMAKHILLVTTRTGDDGSSVDMTEEEKAAVYARMEEFLSQLQGLEGAELAEKFDELMLANTEDPGVNSFPDGYLFQSGDMVPEFEQAAAALAEGELSDIVATSYGYHILLRLPVNYDAIPSAYSQYVNYGYDPSELTLRYLTAQSMFSSVTDGWITNAEIVRTQTLDNLDILKVLGG